MRTRMTSSGTAPGNTGQFGGPAQPVGSAPGKRSMKLGDEVYLWILVGIEVGLLAHFRNMFSRYHGG